MKSHTEVEKLKLKKIKLAQQLETENASNNSSKFPMIHLIVEFESTVSVHTLTIPIAEEYEIFKSILERAFRIKNIAEDLKFEILIRILAENMLCYTSDADVKSYGVKKQRKGILSKNAWKSIKRTRRATGAHFRY